MKAGAAGGYGWHFRAGQQGVAAGGDADAVRDLPAKIADLAVAMDPRCGLRGPTGATVRTAIARKRKPSAGKSCGIGPRWVRATLPNGRIEPDHPKRSGGAQCRLLGVWRSGFSCEPQGETAMNLAVMRLIDTPFLARPFDGVRQLARHLQNEGHLVNQKPVRRLIRLPRCRRQTSPSDGFLIRLRADLPKAQHPQARQAPQDLSPFCGLGCGPVDPIRSAAATSAPFRSEKAALIWWRPWTGSPARVWPGADRTRWRPTSAARPSIWRSTSLDRPRS